MWNADVLVVANRTATSKELIQALRSRAAVSPASFHLLVPATPHGLAWATNMTAGVEEARLRAAAGSRAMRTAGLHVARTEVGDPDPVAATTDELRRHRYDELVVVTLPRHISHWLHISLPQRLERLTPLPITHVVAASPEALTGLPAELAGDEAVNDSARAVSGVSAGDL
jgi:hypothetical protein